MNNESHDNVNIYNTKNPFGKSTAISSVYSCASTSLKSNVPNLERHEHNVDLFYDVSVKTPCNTYPINDLTDDIYNTTNPPVNSTTISNVYPCANTAYKSNVPNLDRHEHNFDISYDVSIPDTDIGSDHACSIDMLYDKHKCKQNKYVTSLDNNISRQTCRRDVIGMRGSVVSFAHICSSDTPVTHDVNVTDNDIYRYFLSGRSMGKMH